MKFSEAQYHIEDKTLNKELLNEEFSDAFNYLGLSFYKKFSVKWNPKLWRIPSSQKILYCSAVYLKNIHQCLVLFNTHCIFKYNFNSYNKESFVSFLDKLTQFILININKDYDTIVVIFPSLSFISEEQQGFTIYKLSQRYKNNLYYSFKSPEESLNSLKFNFRNIKFSFYNKRKIILLGFFEFFSCNKFENISNHSLPNFLDKIYNKILLDTSKIYEFPSGISFLQHFRRFIKCITKELYKNLQVNNIFIADNIFQYTLQCYKKTNTQSLDFWAFKNIPTYFLFRTASLSGLLLVKSIGSKKWIYPHLTSEPSKDLEALSYEGPFYHYDVNSLYPYIMSKFPLPTGQPIIKIFNTEFTNPRKFLEGKFKQFFGFLEVDILLKRDYHSSKNGFFKHPTFAYLFKEYESSFYTKGFYGIFFSPEILYAIEMNLVEKLKIYRSFQYKKTIVFSKLMNSLYPFRDPIKSPYTYKIIKFLMNSFYGNLSINPYKISKVQIQKLTNNKEYKKLHKQNFSSNRSLCEVSPQCFIIRSKKFPPYSYNQKLLDYMHKYAHTGIITEMCDFIENQLPHVSLAITSYGRIFLAKTIYDNKLSILLCNTDSIITKNRLPDEIISQKTMGNFKLVGKYTNIFIKSVNQYIVEKNNKEVYLIGSLPLEDSIFHKNPFEYIKRQIKSLINKRQFSGISNY